MADLQPAQQFIQVGKLDKVKQQSSVLTDPVGNRCLQTGEEWEVAAQHDAKEL